MNDNQKSNQAREVLKRLRKEYSKDHDDFVHWSTPLELVMGTILSAQCTDVQVNKATPALFKKFKTAKDYSGAQVEEIEKYIKTLGFYHSKAKYLKETGRIIHEEFGGKVPDRKEDLLKLKGVSDKTANLVMAKAFGKLTGVAVDTHVKRIAPRLGLSDSEKPKQIEKELERVVDQKDWLDINEFLILHGRVVCKTKPKCPDCVLKDICPSAQKFMKKFYS